MNPRISVIVPVFNAANYLGEALASAQAQTLPPFEIIVIDDGSTDDSAAIAGLFPGVQLARQGRGGISAARNRGIELARGELCALLDADDIWLPRKLELQIAALAQAPAPDLVFGLVEEFISPELPAEIAGRLRAEPGPVKGVLPSALLVTRGGLQRAGLFGSNWRVGEFADWLLRADEAGLRREIVPEVVARRRLHSTNHGIRMRQEFNDYARMIKASLDRRRARDGENGEV